MKSLLIFVLVVFCIFTEKSNSSSSSPWEEYELPENTDAMSLDRSVNLKGWYGKFGNNFIQIRTAFRIAICCKTHLHLLPYRGLPLLKTRFDFTNLKNGDLVSGLGQSKGCDGLQVNWSVGYFTSFLSNGTHPFVDKTEKKLNFSIDESCLYDNHALSNYALYGEGSQDRSNKKNENNNKAMGKVCSKYLKDDALVIQICSGADVFDTKLLNPGSVYYKQLPVAFYQKIIEIKQWKYFIFVTDRSNTESMNPVWTYFHENRQKNMVFPNATSFRTDLHIMACAHHFIPASSTMSDFLTFFNPNLKGIYTFVKCNTVHTNNNAVLCNSYKLNGYLLSFAGN
jgi:hypothetical protein